MTKTIENLKLQTLAAAAALAVAAALGGCQSDKAGRADADESEIVVDEPSDLTAHNRTVVRMALAENVHNGIAAEQAVYPRDFHHAQATFNDLGTRRIETLADVLRGGRGRVVVIRGDASDELYAERVAAVRQHLDDAGLDSKEVSVARDVHVGGVGADSNRSLLTYDRMMGRYAAKQNGGGGGGNGAGNGAGAAG